MTAGMYGRTVVQKETKLSGQGRTISTSTSANCAMTTKSAKTLCHCIKLLYVESIHNGPIFDPQDYAQRPRNEYLSTYSGSVTAINPPQTWYHCTRFCIYHGEDDRNYGTRKYLNLDHCNYQQMTSTVNDRMPVVGIGSRRLLISYRLFGSDTIKYLGIECWQSR